MNNQPKDPLLVRYIERLRDPLMALPPTERDEALKEITQHLKALIDAEQSKEITQNDAIRAALKKFGDPEKIAKKLVQDYWTKAIREQSLFSLWRSLPGSLVERMMIVPICLVAVSDQIPKYLSLHGFWLLLAAATYGVVMGIATGALMSRRSLVRWRLISGLLGSLVFALLLLFSPGHFDTKRMGQWWGTVLFCYFATAFLARWIIRRRNKGIGEIVRL